MCVFADFLEKNEIITKTWRIWDINNSTINKKAKYVWRYIVKEKTELQFFKGRMFLDNFPRKLN